MTRGTRGASLDAPRTPVPEEPAHERAAVEPTPTTAASPTTAAPATTTTQAPAPPVDPALAMFGNVQKEWSEPFPGIRHLRFTADGPQIVHVVEVDIARSEYTLRTTRYDERDATTSDFAAKTGALVAINADYFEYGSYMPYGPAVSNGETWPGATPDRPEWRFIACNEQDECTMDPENETVQLRAEWTEVLGGAGASLIVDGHSITRGDGPHGVDRHPRTAIGLTGDKKMILVVAEGRRSDAIGMTYDEMSALLGDFGAVQGLMLDGGGSTTLVIGGARVSDLPAEQAGERPVANHLAIVRAG